MLQFLVRAVFRAEGATVVLVKPDEEAGEEARYGDGRKLHCAEDERGLWVEEEGLDEAYRHR